MTSANLLLPLRIPELGPSFGKLITGTGRKSPRIPLDDLRLQLVTEVIERCGEARRLNANDERDAAVNALGRDEWMNIWERTVAQVAERVVERITEHIAAEGRAVNMPERLRRQIALDPTERRALTARIGSAGVDLIPALDAIYRWSEPARTATALKREDMEQWQNALRSAARRLETSWLALEEAVDAEVDQWLEVGNRVAAWRRPLWPVVVVGAIVTAAAVCAGLLMGGVLPTPAWLRSALGAVGLS